MKFLQNYIRIIDRFNDKIGRAVAWLSTILVLVVCYDVFTRYLLRESSVAVQELEWHLFALLFLLAGAFTLKDDRHVRVDVFYARFSKRVQAGIDLFGSIIFLIPFAIVAILASKDFVINSFMAGEKSPDPGGLPARYILKAVIPLAFILLLLQGFSELFKSLLTLLNRTSDTEEKTI